MSHAIVIRGRYAGKSFIPSEPLPDAEGAAELIIFAPGPKGTQTAPASIFELIGKAERLRTADDIDAQVRSEREAWGEE